MLINNAHQSANLDLTDGIDLFGADSREMGHGEGEGRGEIERKREGRKKGEKGRERREREREGGTEEHLKTNQSIMLMLLIFCRLLWRS